ncbi:EXS family-domain-containing protein [Plectosphaerella plurivora]|uniref:EXS family-domain-containing protein n=1 Tax=Plectosphaerella plurivora TaxID=936078 RepID=A0A9P8VHH5_9PEZI|nr:EXS family-domain-containing protein [Plectosphaerella plurivora]
MYLYYPVVLIGLSVCIILFPARVFAPSSRRWFAYAHWRLLLAGFYPVEFRDFFLGDIYCSLTYAVCNVSLFFCLYANEWENPVQCNSNHSRLMGFFGALPPIWRLLQCLRRYYDTRNIFPHLINGGKYCMSIMAAVTLSLYRMNGTRSNLGMFIAFATVNGVYTSIWDLFMDFSLLQPSARHRYLRDITALKKRWIYYAIMVADPFLRFSWVFYPIFTHDTQHSTVMSFAVSFAEVFRRGIWALLRVENEHCANVAVYKASRDVPLPYRLQPLVENISEESRPGSSDEEHPAGEGNAVDAATATATSVQRVGTHATIEEEVEVGAQSPSATGTVRRRKGGMVGSFRGIQRSFSKIIAEAHRQDFVKKRKPDETTGTLEGSGGPQPQSDDDDDEEDEEEDEAIEAAEQGLRKEAEEGHRSQRAGGSSSRG